MSRSLRLSFVTALMAAPLALAQTPAAPMSRPPPAAQAKAEATPAPAQAVAVLKNAKGQKVGTVTLTEAPHGVMVKGELMHLSPGPHAIHIHETGKCEAPKFTSAGGHFNPAHKQHGFMVPEGMHAGDLPNLIVPANGQIHFEYFDPNASLSGDNTVFDADGAAVVVHAKADDYKSQPAGDAGDRVACGVIEKK